MADREGPIQRAIIAYLEASYPGCVVAHVPNSTDIKGKDIARQIAKQKHNGMLPGYPDLIFHWRGATVAFEVKAEGNSTSKAQKEVLARLTANGIPNFVVRSIDDVTECMAPISADPRGPVTMTEV